MIYLNNDPVPVTIFPDNTSQIWKLDENNLNLDVATIRWDFSHEGEIMQIAQLAHLLHFSGVDRIYLDLDYLPYGRQDKWISNDATFALHSFASIINSLHFYKVSIMDPHSQVALELINKSKAFYPFSAIQHAWSLTNSEIACYPDKGAKDKYQDLYKFESRIFGNKTRDQATGRITGYELHGTCVDRRILIVDDICDGGATFKILAEALYNDRAEDVNLFVTHGLFSQGLKPLFNAGISRVFTKEGEAFHQYDGVVIRTWDRLKTDAAIEFYNS